MDFTREEKLLLADLKFAKDMVNAAMEWRRDDWDRVDLVEEAVELLNNALVELKKRG